MGKVTHLSSLLAARRAKILERWTRRIDREHSDTELTPGEPGVQDL